MEIEPADPASADAERLLGAHAAELAVRYPTGSWAGTGGRKDALWLARDAAGAAVGCIALRVIDDRLVEVKHLYVAPAARRGGTATALMDALEAEADRRGAEVVLETGLGQPEAIALYRARGYRDRGAYPGADPDTTDSIYLGRPASRS